MSESGGTPPSTRLAAALIATLIEHGVTDLVVCPGSRSQALALAAAEAESLGAVRLHVRIDERSAAFFALGIARETGIPAPVIVTSGSAVANLLPAVLEAHHARVPMILLTADRPEELRGVRASQTTSTSVYTQPFMRFTADIPAPAGIDDASAPHLATLRQMAADAFTAATQGSAGSGPAHLNIAFRDPLSGGQGEVATWLRTGGPAAPPAPPATAGDTGAHTGESVYVYGADGASRPAVVIAGADAGPDAAAFARAAGLPLLAEPSSGARFGREAIQHWTILLREPELASAIEQVIVFGHPGLTREVPALIERDGIETVVIDPVGSADLPQGVERYNPGRRVRTFATRADVSEHHDPALARPWLGAWVLRDRELRAEHTTQHEPDLDAARATGYRERNAYARDEVARLRMPTSREHLAETLWLATWPHDRLVLAASRLIRVMNRQAPPRNIRVHANRGLAGIDGTIATALGIAVAAQSHPDPRHAAGTTRALIGDLALFHDAGSLALPDPAHEPWPRIQLIVGNDGGGTIFDQLEVAETADPAAFERVMLTPQRVDVAALAAAYGWEYLRIEQRGELERLFTMPVTGPQLIEVPLQR